MPSSSKEINPIDAHLGRCVRDRRVALSISQETLGDALGVSFQQVQKYEKGTNRISASTLFEIARVLSVEVSDFFPVPEGRALSGAITTQAHARSGYGAGFHDADASTSTYGSLPPLSEPDVERLVSAFSKVRDPKVRRRIIELVDALIDGSSART